MKIKKLNINTELLNNLKEKTLSVVHDNGEKVVVVISIAALATVMGLAVGAFANKGKNYDSNKEILTTYHEQVNNIDDEKFDYYNEAFQELVEYIELSEEMHDLKLYSAGNGEINSYDYEIRLESIEQVKNKINDYKELKKLVHANNDKVNDEVIAYSKIVYELRNLEEQVNQKVYDGYNVVENYGKLNAKSMLASKYDVAFDDTEVHLYDNGEVNSVVASNPTNELDRYLDELNKVYQMDDGKSKVLEGGYNHDRNKVLKDAVVILTERSVKYIQKNNLIGENTKIK